MFLRPVCDSRDCWYKRNPDRLNEYKESKTLVCNIDKALRRDITIMKSLPYTFQLCDGCYSDFEITDKECTLCGCLLYDDWITLEDNCHYCSLCITEHDLKQYLLVLCGGNEDSLVEGNCPLRRIRMRGFVGLLFLENLDVTFSTSAGNITTKELIIKVVQQKRSFLLQTKHQQQQHKRKRSTSIEEQLVQLFDLESEKIAWRIVSKHLPTNIQKLPEFQKHKRAKTLLWLLDRKAFA